MERQAALGLPVSRRFSDFGIVQIGPELGKPRLHHTDVALESLRLEERGPPDRRKLTPRQGGVCRDFNAKSWRIPALAG